MRIGAIVAPVTSVNYRVIHPFEALSRRGHEVVWPGVDGTTPLEDLRTCDAVVVYRMADHTTRQAIVALKQDGIGVVWDNDDDLSRLPKSRALKRSNNGMSNERIFAEMMRTARMCHFATAPTEVLADVFRRRGLDDVAVVPNMLRDSLVRARRDHDGITVGWIASWEHRTDALGVGLTDALRRLQEKHPRLGVTTVGVELGLRERYGHAAGVPFDQLPRVMAEFDIGIAPLLDTPFNRCRSDIKVKEYAASQVPWLASRVGPYAHLGERQGGRLVDDDGWYAALDALIADAGARKELAQAGQGWSLTQTVDTIAADYERLIGDAVEQASGRRPATVIRTAAQASMHDQQLGGKRFVARIPRRLVAAQQARGDAPRA